MIVMRRVKIEVNRPKIGDRIQVGHYTATCQEITPKGAIFLLDQYLDKAYPMNLNNTNKGGYAESNLREKLKSKKILDIFKGVRDHMIPLDDGDLLRIPFAGEMFGDKMPEWCEPDGHKQWPLMQDRRNRLASRCGVYEWGWINNKSKSSSTNFCSVDYIGFAGNWNASDVLGVRPVFLIAEEGKAKIHQLKILDCFADEIIAGNKMFELRKNDRDYQKGDYICFTVISDESEREIKHAINTRLYEITCVLSGWGLMDGYVALGIREAGWGRKRNAIDRED